MQTCSIAGARYKALLENFVISELQQRNVIYDIYGCKMVLLLTLSQVFDK